MVVLLASCEVIREDDRLIELPQPIAGEQAHVLVDYTGFRCVNCPKAAEMAEELQGLYGERLIVVSMHPASNPFTQGKYDYTCPAADTYYQLMGGTASTPFPAGNIDFTQHDNTYFADYLQWPTMMSEAMQQDSRTSITAQAQLREKEIIVRTEVSAEQEKQCKVVVWLMEDSIVGMQAMPDGTANSEYIHMHMLRTTGKEVWGKDCKVSYVPTACEDTISLPDGCVAKNCHVVSILMDAESKEIYNATQVTIQNPL